jgi:serine/threonine-protein kinase
MSTDDPFKTGGGLRDLEQVLATAEDPLVGQTIGSYRVQELIAEGGMGRVYSATRDDGQFDREVAIKILPRGMSNEHIKRFEQEQKILASLTHPNIAQLYDAGFSDSSGLFLVMELIDGHAIDVYARENALSTNARIRLMLTLCEALTFAHAKLVVHRDLKPSNVFVSSEGQLKLLDFGIAKILEAPDDVTVESRPMTPQYASPEQILNEPISVASDIYQLGLLFLSLFEQHPEVQQETRASATERAVRKTSLTAESRLAEKLPVELDAIINQCLRAEPSERYTSATDLATDLGNYLAGFPVSARNPGAMQRGLKFLRRNTAAVTSAMGVVLLITATIVFYTNRLADQRDIAEAAAEEARVEAARAEHVADFLVDLFRASEPDGPAGQLPTTADLLELGAQRALDPSSAPPEERLRMLLILGHVLLEQSRYDHARPLLDAAVDLARGFNPPQPDSLARALLRRAYLEWRGGSLADAKERLKEAEALVDGVDEHINLWAKAVMDRAWVASMQQDNVRAAALLQPLVDAARTRTGIDPGTMYRALERQSSIHQKLGNLDTSASLRAEAEPYLLSAHGSEGRAYAVFLANSSNLEHSLGRFENALKMNRRALELYDSIYAGQPVSYRAVARRNLARKLLAAGRFDEGMTELMASTAELAEVRSLSPDQDASHHFYHGELMLLMRRWAEAGQHLERTRATVMTSEDASESSLLPINAMLVWAACQQGISHLQSVPPAALEALLVEPLTMGGDAEARIRSARACMHWRQGRLESAKSEIDLALGLVTDAGALLERTERMIVRARILESMGDLNAARTQVGAAIELFAVHGVNDHPNVAAFRRLEQELAGAPLPAKVGSVH